MVARSSLTRARTDSAWTAYRREIAAIDEKLPASESAASVRSHFKKLRAVVVDRIHNLSEYLATDPGLARMHFLRHLNRIDVHPNGPRCIAKRDWDLLGC